MNDSAISRAIARTHFAIVSVILFCLGVTILLYLTLSSGLHVAKLKLGPVNAEELYIKWDNTLSVSIERVGITPSKNSAKDTGMLSKTLSALLRHADASWVGTLDIRHFQLSDLNGSVHYDPRGLSRIALHTVHVQGDITLRPDPALVRTYAVSVSALSDDFDAVFSGAGTFDLAAVRLQLNGDLNVSDDIRLKTDVAVRSDAADISVHSQKPFASVAPLVTPMHLSPAIEQWIVDRAQGGPLELHTLHTTIPFDDPAKGLANLYGHLTFENARYAFANDPAAFEPALARKVEVVFEEKTLKIVPIESSFYGLDGGSTWLEINFGTPQTMLMLYLNTAAALTPPLHRLIASYGIDLPFVQTGGKTDVALTLAVNLVTNKTKAEGDFAIAQGRLDFSGLPVELNASAFSLNDSNVTFKKLNVALFDGNVTTTVRGTLDPAKNIGALHFDLHRVRFAAGQETIALLPGTGTEDFTYEIRPEQDRLLFKTTAWKLGEHRITTRAFEAPFDYDRLSFELPPTLVSYDEDLKAKLHGTVNLRNKRFDLSAQLFRLAYGTFHNADVDTVFRIRMDDNLSIETNETTRWTLDENTLYVGPMHLSVPSAHAIRFAPMRIRLEPLLAGTVDGTVDLQTLSAELAVNRFHFDDATLSQLFESQESFAVYAVPVDDEINIVIPDYNMLFSAQNEGWKLHFFSLQSFTDKSPLLRDYNLSESALTVSSKDGGYPIDFSGTVNYPYAIAVQNGAPVTEYRFRGRFEDDESISASINDAIYLSVNNERLRMVSNHVAYNLDEIMHFYRDHGLDRESNDTEANLPVFFDANDTAVVFSDGRKAVADKIAMQYENRRVTAQLFRKNGGAMLGIEKGHFYLFGKQLDDVFMEHIFNLSRFKGGTLEFYVMGTKDNFSGLVKINKTTIYDYVLLNNLFAFINTVPALVTFSLPSYETKGIKIKSAYADLKYDNGILTVSGIKIDSKEMDFAGEGTVNYNSDRINLMLSVKTEAGENIRKIPVVGYILSGDDNSVLTTVKVTGPIENPNISSTIAKDIAVTPFNILRRTLDFPLHYLKKIDEATK